MKEGRNLPYSAATEERHFRTAVLLRYYDLTPAEVVRVCHVMHRAVPPLRKERSVDFNRALGDRQQARVTFFGELAKAVTLHAD